MLDADQIAYLKGCPPELRDIVSRFPLNCRVRARAGHHLDCPAPGNVGRVVGWGTEAHPLQYKCVQCDDWHGGDAPEEIMVKAANGERGAVCTPDQLEVVRYSAGITPDVLTELWAEADELASRIASQPNYVALAGWETTGDRRCPRCRERFTSLDDILLVHVNPEAEPYMTNMALLCWKCAQTHEVETGQIKPGESPITGGPGGDAQ